MSVEKLVEHFSALEDPRCAGKVEHRLIDILVIVVCAVIACAERRQTQIRKVNKITGAVNLHHIVAAWPAFHSGLHQAQNPPHP